MPGSLSEGDAVPCFLFQLQTMKELKDYFCTSVMEKLGTQPDRTVLLLDSLDQLRDFGCKLRDWIPKNLPENVTLLISCIPAEEFVVGPELKVRPRILTHCGLMTPYSDIYLGQH